MEANGFYETNYSAYEDQNQNNNNQNPNFNSGGNFNAYNNLTNQEYYQPNNNFNNIKNTAPAADMYGGGFEDEPPLLEELGINFDHILQKTKLVLNPLRSISSDVVNETDFTGPLVFLFTLASLLLFAGKMHFGYIYGISVFAVFIMWILLKLMAPQDGPSFGTVTSILGYCLLPIVLLSGVAVIFSLKGITGTILAAVSVCWCSWSSSKLFCSALSMNSSQPLVAYPCAMLYGVFALLTVF